MTIEEMARLYAEGVPVRDIANRAGCVHMTVINRLRRAGVPPRRFVARAPRRLHRLPLAELVRRYRAGETAQEIGRAYGCSGTTIGERLRAAGVAMRPRCWRPRALREAPAS